MDVESKAAEQTSSKEPAISGNNVIPLPRKIRVGYTFNIEVFRLIGLCAGMVLLFVGTFMTWVFVEFPKESDMECYNKLLEGFTPNGKFQPEATYIFQLFHFNHTCTVLDFNPSKTLSALVVQFSILPLCLFTVLSYFRIRQDWSQGQVTYSLYIFSKIITPFNFVCFLYFYMVFVNSPYNKDSFTLHYIPYMFYQFALMLMAFEQCFYVIQRKLVPFNPPNWVVYTYLGLLVFVCTFYTIFVWSFLIEAPIVDTTKSGPRGLAIFTMFFFDFLAVIFPAIMAGIHCKQTDKLGQRSYVAYYDADDLQE